MSNTFSSYFQQQALVDQLPFKIDFEIAPIESDITKNAGGLEFRIVNDLVSRESWFFNAVESLNTSTVKQAATQLRGLSAKLKSILDLPSLSVAQDILWNGSDEYKSDERYIKFFEENYEAIQELVETMMLAQNNLALNWMRVTFFILSRVTPDWSLSQTAMLTGKQIDEILHLITIEMNGGVEPEETPILEDEESDSEGK